MPSIETTNKFQWIFLSFSVFVNFMTLGCTKKQEAHQLLPGASAFDPALLKKFEEKRKERGKDYRPRTKHLTPNGWAQYTNRLFLETSPYLLQHAHNPVDWYPWGNEAFERAQELKRPVLLSIGYSTCHWCHVMEEESFEDEEIAKVLNENYIAIKIDREERPDIDAIYMSAVQAMTGGGGWPMTVWLTPERKPFFGGTYFPARDGDRGSRIGFLSLLKQIRKAYDEEPEKLVQSSQQLLNAIVQMSKPNEGSRLLPKSEILHKVIKFYLSRFDASDGGLSGAPKFPSSLPVRLMLRHYRRTGDKTVLQAATLSLEKMKSGGIYDQVGGGFHRYSTDAKWLVPHFEKMLYDNALLAMTYVEAFQVTGNSEFKRVTEEILQYVKRDMTSPQGAFYSATDADSLNPSGHREEGWFFTWTPAEMEQVLGKKDAEFLKAYYGVTSSGNFEGRNILHVTEPLSTVAKRFNVSDESAWKKIETGLEKLYHARLTRPTPIRDEKILTAWNGLLISAYARAGLILNKSEYITMAQKASEFVLNHLYKSGRLLRSFKEGTARLNAYLDDYAFFIAALLDLFEATSELKWLQYSIELDQTLETFFEDKTSGGFFMTSLDHEKLLAREKPAHDGAEPSGNSIAVSNLLRLSALTSDDSYRKRAERALQSFSETLQSNPVALSEMLLAVDFYLNKIKEIVIVTPKGKQKGAEFFLAELRKQFLPHKILVVLEEGDEIQRYSKIIPFVKAKVAQKSKVTAYVCEKGLCQLPTTDPGVFAKQINLL